MGERKGARGLELWCKKITNGYPGVNITNMTTSWRDGLAFCAIIHHFRPELIDFNKLKKDDIYYNNELAFNIAERHFGIPALLEPHDMVEFEVPDRLSILTYLSQFYQTFRMSQVDVKPTEEGLKNSLRQIHLESVGGNTLTSKSSMVQGDHTTPKTSLMQSSKVSYSELPKQSILQQTPKTSITQNLKTSITNTGGITASSKAKVLKNSVTLPKESLVKNDNIKRASEKSTIDSKLTKINSTIVGLIDECNDKHITDDDKLKKLKSVDEKLFDDVCDECDCGCGLEFCLCQATLKKPPINSGDNCHCVPKTKAQIENEENAVCKCGCDTEGCLCMAETLPCSCYWNDNDDDDDDDSGDSADDLPNSKGIQCELIKSNTCKQCTT